MLRPYVHVAVLAMPGDVNQGAPGAAITLELCGSLDHPPPCPLAPHYTGAHRTGLTVRLRVLFAAEPRKEKEVRARIVRALASQSGRNVDGTSARWRLVSASPANLLPRERKHAARLAKR